MDLFSLKTPSLLLDLNRLKANAERVSDKVRSLNINLRPHIKTHKCVEIAQIQTAGHFGGVTISTLAEGHALAAHGFSDFTYAVPIEPGKFAAAIELSKKCQRLFLVTDDLDIPFQLDEAARHAGVTLDVLMEVDCGDHRCGVEPFSFEALELPQRIADSKNLRLAGILTHAGHSYHARSKDECLQIAQQERDVMVELARRLRSEGIPVETISIGSTPTVTSVNHLDGVTEVRPGNYIFFDAFQETHGVCSVSDCAVMVLAAVIHRDQTKVVIDAGAIALSKDRGACDLDPSSGYGRVFDLEGTDLELRVTGVSQEHGEIECANEDLRRKLKVGTRVRILANHSCLTAAQHSHYQVLEGTRIVDCWKIHRGW